MNWFIIILTILAIIFLFIILKFKEVRHKLGFIFILLLLIFFGFSVLQIYQSGVDLKTFDGFVAATKLYFNWLANLFGNVADVSGYAIHQDWGVNKTLIK